ncbi:MAG: hypothetical protein SGILL_003661 [Bacillariaceae sp.]
MQFVDDDGLPFMHCDIQDEELVGGLPEDSRLVIAARLLHWFLRQITYHKNDSVDGHSLSEGETMKIITYLSDTYLDTEAWKDYYDVTAIKVKRALIYLNSELSGDRALSSETREELLDSRFISLCQVCDALCGMKKFDEGGAFLGEAARFFDGQRKVGMLQRAASAMKNGDAVTNAEQYYVECISSHRSWIEDGGYSSSASASFQPDHEIESHIWNEFIDILRALTNASESGSAKEELNGATMSLLSLLVVSGWTKPDCVTSFDQVRNLPQIVLKVAYRRAPAAKRKLFDVFASSDPSSVRRSLLDAATNIASEVTFTPPAATPEMTRQQPSAKKLARAELAKRKTSGTLCAVCGQQLQRQFVCPCKTVSYCGRECQVAHWRNGHKQECPLRNGS